MGKRKQPPAEDVDEATEASAASSQQPKFGLALASHDVETRDKAVKALTRYLKRAHDIGELELRKIWKALFYCFWHSDKPKVQADLAERLAALVHAMPPGKAWPFVRVFWQTMIREWETIDRLRLDKFYVLMRRSLEHSVHRLRGMGWADEEVAQYAGLLRDGPLARTSPAGVRYFLADSFVNALRHTRSAEPEPAAASAADKGGGGGKKGKRKKGVEGGGKQPAGGGERAPSARPALSPIAPSAVMAVVEPFMLLLGEAEDDTMARRVVQGVIDPLLRAAEAEAEKAGRADGDHDDAAADDDDDDDDDESPKLDVPLGPLSERLFEVAAAKGTLERNRPSLYRLQSRVEALLAQAEAPAAAPPPSKPKPAKRSGGGKSASPDGSSARAAAKASALASMISAKSAKRASKGAGEARGGDRRQR